MITAIPAGAGPVSGPPDIYTVATEHPAQNGVVTIKLSPGLAAYSFTFG